MVRPLIIPFKGNLIEAFGRISHLPWAFLLDSASSGAKNSRYSFAGANPIHTFSASGGFVTIDGHTTIDRPREALQRFAALSAKIKVDPYLPFSGGMVGFMGLEWAATAGGLAPSAYIPDVSFGIYDTAVAYDHVEDCGFLFSLGLKEDGSTDETLARKRVEDLFFQLTEWPHPLATFSYPPFGSHPIVASLTKDSFIGAVETLKFMGQAPLFAERFKSPTNKRPWQVYLDLRGKNKTPFAAYFNGGDYHILTSSRTCILRVLDDVVETHPAKGCVMRVLDKNEDHLKVDQLRYDEERQNAHRHLVSDLMVALSGVCEPGSIDVTNLAHIESDGRAHHMVSDIVGSKRSFANAIDCVMAVLPVATTDKKSGQLATRFEGTARNIYTGTIGFVSGRNAEFNLAFRTLVFKDTIGYLHVGTEVSRSIDSEEAYFKADSSAAGIFNIVNKQNYATQGIHKR